jgi:hypothetical protein
MVRTSKRGNREERREREDRRFRKVRAQLHKVSPGALEYRMGMAVLS